MKKTLKRVLMSTLALLAMSAVAFNTTAREIIVRDQVLWKPSDTGLEYKEADLNHYVEPSASEDHVYDVTLEISGKTEETTAVTDVVFLLDVSYSMEGDKFTELKLAMKEISKKLVDNGNFNVGIVEFSGHTNVAVELTNDYTAIEAAIDASAIVMGDEEGKPGGTFTQLGLRAAKEMLQAETSQNEKVLIVSQ